MAAKLPDRNTRASIACIACRARKHRVRSHNPSVLFSVAEPDLHSVVEKSKILLHHASARSSTPNNLFFVGLGALSAVQVTFHVNGQLSKNGTTVFSLPHE